MPPRLPHPSFVVAAALPAQPQLFAGSIRQYLGLEQKKNAEPNPTTPQAPPPRLERRQRRDRLRQRQEVKALAALANSLSRELRSRVLWRAFAPLSIFTHDLKIPEGLLINHGSQSRKLTHGTLVPGNGLRWHYDALLPKGPADQAILFCRAHRNHAILESLTELLEEDMQGKPPVLIPPLAALQFGQQASITKTSTPKKTMSLASEKRGRRPTSARCLRSILPSVPHTTLADISYDQLNRGTAAAAPAEFFIPQPPLQKHCAAPRRETRCPALGHLSDRSRDCPRGLPYGATPTKPDHQMYVSDMAKLINLAAGIFSRFPP
ncbi:hypothetical protein B0T20DRAFT_391293 [Sordaria brevicollis]|uniref:Uncharacterized protein n=1 Tax=Sordaria brevicollis TaxID=83679 RepID=A0AAE0UD43_SORBR|nr:hypothetical protein B0T20DRAFT_391293 [Sordaria brevicollis]